MYITCIWIAVLACFPCGGRSLESLQELVPLQFTDEPGGRLFAVPKEPFRLTCQAVCRCSQNLTTWWTKNDTRLQRSSDRGHGFQQLDSGNLDFGSFVHKPADGITDSGSYRCFVSNGDFTLVSRVVVVAIASLPTPSLVDSDVTALALGEARFQCKDNGALPAPSSLDIKWFKDGVLLLPKNDSKYRHLPGGILHVTNAAAVDGGQYRCNVTSGRLRMSKQSAAAQLTIVSRPLPAPPAFLYVTKDLTLTQGEPGILECFASGYPAPVVHILKVDDFSREKTLSTGTGFATFQWTTVSNGDAGTYICEVSADSTVMRQSIAVQVDAPPSFDNQLLKSVLARPENRPVTLRCPAHGSPRPTVEWFFKGLPVTPDDNIELKGNVLAFRSTKMSDAGLYQCFASNSLGLLRHELYFRVKKAVVGTLSEPRNIIAEALSSKEILVTWDPPFNQSVIAYTIYWKEVDSFEWKSAVPANNGKYTLGRLYGGTKYIIELQAFSHYLGGLRSKAVTCKTSEDVPAISPSHITVDNIGNMSLRVSWQPVPRQFSNGHIVLYHIYYGEIGIAFVDKLVATALANETALTLHHLVHGKLYSIEVASSTSAGEGPRSPVTTVEVHGPSTAALDRGTISATWLNSSAAKVSWEVKHTCDTFDGISVVYIPISSNNYWKDSKSILLKSSAKEIMIGNLDHNHIYRVELFQNCRSMKALSVAVTVLAEAPIQAPRHLPGSFGSAPSQPRHVKCITKNRNAIYVSWDKPLFGDAFVSYVVKQTEGGLSPVAEPEYSTVNQELLLENLDAGVWYYITVGAGSQFGQRTTLSQSNMVTCKTTDTRPAAPVGVSGKLLVKKSSLAVYWSAPTKVDGIVTEYVIRYGLCGAGLQPTWSKYMLRLQRGANQVYGTVVKVNSLQDYCLTVAAINHAGEGRASQPLMVELFPGATSAPAASAQTPSRPYTDAPPFGYKGDRGSNGMSNDIRMGIIVGCAVALGFLLIFIVVFIWKNPFRMRKTERKAQGLQSGGNNASGGACYVQQQQRKATNWRTKQPSRSTQHQSVCNGGSEKRQTVVELTGNSSNGNSACVCTCLLSSQPSNQSQHSAEKGNSGSTHDSGMQTASSASEERATPDSTTRMLPNADSDSSRKEQKTSTRVLFHRVQETTFQV